MTAGDAPQPTPQAKPLKPPDPRSAAFLLLGVTLPILLSLVMKSWVSGSRQGAEAGIGLTGIEVCLGGACNDLSWATWKLDGDVSTFATLSLILGIACLLVAATYGGLALKSLAHKLPSPKFVVWLFALTGFVMAYFAIRVITESPGGLGPGAAMVFGLLGVIAGGVGMRRLGAAALAPAPSVAPAKTQAPQLDAETAALLAPGPASQPASVMPFGQGCPRCASPLTFVQQYQSWFCERCRQYATRVP